MNKFLAAILLIININAFAFSEQVRQSVWVNEAIISAYQYNAGNIMEKQQQLSKYFSPSGWQAYSQALVASNLLDTVKKNNFSVSAVALEPPKIKKVAPNHWQAKMPILVLYENPKFSERQTLMVTITFQPAAKARAEQRFMIGSMQSKLIDDPCAKKTKHKSSSSNGSPAKGK